MGGEIQVMGPSVHQDVVARLNSSCELVRDELGKQLNWLRGIQGKLDEEVHHLANDVDSKLVKSSARSDRQEKVIIELHAEMGKSTEEIESNRNTTFKHRNNSHRYAKNWKGRITR